MRRRAAQRLFVFLPAPSSFLEASAGVRLTAATVVAYARIDLLRRQRRTGDAPLTLLPESASVDLLFDVSELFTAVLETPPMSEGLLRQALPGLVEERLLTEVGDCHLCHRLEAREANRMRVAVAAIDRGALARALQACSEAQLRPRCACSALYTIPAPSAGTLSIRLSRGRGTVRTAEHSGFAFDLASDPPAALAIVLRQLNIRRIDAYGRDAKKLLLPIAARLGVRVIDTQRDFHVRSIARAVNLLQGEFGLAGPFGMPTASAWVGSGRFKPMLAWASVSMAMFIVGLNAYRLKLDLEAGSLRTSMHAAFHSAFPAEAAVEPVAQTQRHLLQLRARAGRFAPDDFSVLNAKAAYLLAGLPLGSLAGIEYHDTALTLKFKSGIANPGLQAALRARAAQKGLNLDFDADGSARVAAN